MIKNQLSVYKDRRPFKNQLFAVWEVRKDGVKKLAIEGGGRRAPQFEQIAADDVKKSCDDGREEYWFRL